MAGPGRHNVHLYGVLQWHGLVTTTVEHSGESPKGPGVPPGYTPAQGPSVGTGQPPGPMEPKRKGPEEACKYSGAAPTNNK